MKAQSLFVAIQGWSPIRPTSKAEVANRLVATAWIKENCKIKRGYGDSVQHGWGALEWSAAGIMGFEMGQGDLFLPIGSTTDRERMKSSRSSCIHPPVNGPGRLSQDFRQNTRGKLEYTIRSQAHTHAHDRQWQAVYSGMYKPQNCVGTKFDPSSRSRASAPVNLKMQ